MGGGMFGGMPSPEMMQQMMQSPMFNQMMEQVLSNPEMMEQMTMADPRLRSLMDSNPELRAAMRDPQLMRQSMEMMRNPRLREEMLRQQDRAISNLEAMPGGFNHLRRMTEEVLHPMQDAMMRPRNGNSNSNDNDDDGASDEPNPFDALFADDGETGEGSAEGGPRNTQPMPNPWASSTSASTPASSSGSTSQPSANPFGSLFGPSSGSSQGNTSNTGAAPGFPFGMMPPAWLGGNMGTGTQAQGDQQGSQQAPPAERFANQLQLLRDMGFTDEEANVQALSATNGNVHLAVQRLLGQ